MAITKCFLMRESRSGTFEKYGQRNMSEIYIVESDNRFDGPAKIWELGQALTRTATTATLPALQSYYTEYDASGEVETTDTGIYMMRMSIVQHDNPYRWRATANYRPLKQGETSLPDVASPSDLPIRYWLEFASASEIIRQALNVEPLGGIKPGSTDDYQRPSEVGPIVNGALQDFDEPLEGVRHRSYLVGERPVSNLTEILGINELYDGTENSNNFYGYDPGHARYAGVSTSQELELNGIKYYLATIRVELSRKRFQHVVVNRGYKYRDATSEAKLINNNQSEPTLLDHRGFPIPEGQKGTTITYRDLTPANYNALGI